MALCQVAVVLASKGESTLFGVALTVYALFKFSTFVRKRKAYGEIALDRRYGITTRLFCATNNCIALFSAFLIFNCLETALSAAPNAAAYGEAYGYAAVAMALMTLALLFWSYSQLFLNAQRREAIAPKAMQRVGKLRAEFKKRGIDEFELVLVPLSGLSVAIAPMIAPLTC